uniref:Beta/gamma crystallin 'Greek key' domain-containing protein n=1 Tax=Leptobrachium leishanense TaxID=445787 RepID=A0A8C5LQ95_9ANUR
MSPPETDYEVSVTDMEEPSRGATDPVKSAMDFLPHPGPVLDTPSYIEENAINVEGYQTNEGDMQYSADRNLQPKKSMKTSNVKWHPMGRESPTSVGELRPNNCPPDEDVTRESPESLQISHMRINNIVEGEELDNISLIRGDSNVHPQSAPMTIEEFKTGVGGNSGAFDSSHPVLESDLFTTKSAREKSDGKKNGNFIHTKEHTQPGSDIEYNEPEFTANAEAEANNDDQSVTDSEDNSSTLVNWTPHDIQINEIRTLSPSFSDDVTKSMKLPDVTHVPRPRLNFTEDICAYPVNADLSSEGNLVANNEFNDFHPSFRVTENNSPVKPKNASNTLEVHHQSAHEAPMTIEEFKKGVTGNPGTFDYSHPVLESDLFTSKSAREHSDGNKNGNFIQTQEHTQNGSDIEYNESEFTANAEAEANNDDQSVTDSVDNSSTLVNWTPHDMQSKKISTLSPSFPEDVTRSLKLPDATYLPRPRLNFTEDVCTSPVTTDSTSDGNMVANNEFNDFHPSFRVTENNSPVKQTTPALSFDNSIDFLSSPHTTSSQSPLSPAGYISLRADSPLPSSDGIDSGVVSSQAYTPEENTIVNISPSELYNNLEFASNQKPNLINLIEPNKEILERSVSANSHFDSTNKLGILPTQTEEHVSDKKEGIPTRNSSYTNDNEIPLHRCLDNDESMDKNVPSVYRERNDSLNVKPGDVYVAKVCVKSVDVEEVKMTPCSLKTEVVAISKLVAPRFEPEFISIPNVPSSPSDKDSENIRNNNFSPHSEPTDGIVSNVDNIQTKPRDSRGLLQKYQQEQDDTENPCWIFENNQNFMPNDEDMSLSPDVRREPAGNLPYPKSKHPCISSDAERVNNFMEVIPEMQPNDRNLSDTINSYGNEKNVTVAFVNGKNEETSDRPNVVNHDASLELHNANYIPSGEINANALTLQDPSLQSTITNQKIDLKINSTEDTYDQKHINDVIVTIRPHKKASTISEETKSLLKPEYNSEETENAVTELTPNVQSDFSSGTTSQDIEQIADYGNDIVENQRLYPSETNPEYDSSFSVHNGFYVEVGESDEETVDEENDADGEGLDSDSQSSMQLRRVPFYPISLSPIYEDDSSSEDVLSNRASPRCIEGQDESTNANDHTSILSLLQSVSNRLKEEGISSLDNENTCNKIELTQTTNETENATSPSFNDAAYINDKGEKSTESSQGASRHGLFITKSIIDNRPVLGLGRKSIFLHMNPQVGTYGSKSSSESTPLSDSESKTPGMEEKSSTLTETELSTDLSDSAPVKPPATSPLPDVTVQASDMEPKPPFSPKSAYYQYFNDVSNQAEHTDNRKSNKQEKMDSAQKFSPQKADSLMRSLSNSDAIRSNPRPGKVVISDLFEHEMKFEMYSDILDATSLIFPNGVNIRVIRGCWILYEKPDFQGQAHVLEEGEAVLQQLWGPPESKSRPEQVIIGSLKRVTKDYLPEVVLTRLYGTSGAPICLRTEIPSLKKHLDSIPRSLEVIAGVWLAYTDPQFTGSVSVLEEGSILPSVPESGIQSLRPLKLGGLKVQLPSQPRIILYQKPYFEGWSKEITDHVYSIKTMICEDHVIGSIKVIGGIWVGYEKERYKGTQYLLEEGEYEDWNAWGGISDTLQSIRYLHADVLETSVTLFESEAEDGKLLDLFNQAVPDLESSGYRRETQCIHVKKGIWVAYQQKYFCGEQYILEKGRYKSCMDWGGKTNTIMSIRPVMLEPLGKEEPKHMMAAFSDENFQGRCEYHIEETCEFPEFPPRSFKVLRGCWLLCYQADTCENLCVLEEGNFPDLVTCGCPAAVIKYIKPIDYVFAEPAISLFALDLCEGRELSFDEPVTSVLSKDLNFYTQSVWIRRGLWIAFEGPNFLGQQLLLEAGQILNWTEYSGWKAIGSLRPLKQTPVYFRIKNRHNDKYLTLTGTLMDTSATFVCVSARNGQNTQIWYFCRGLLKSKATDSCLDVIGGKNLPGAKVSLWVENGKHRQKWRINKDGTITSYLSDDLVLDLKGGNFYDQNYIVVNRVQQDVATQKGDTKDPCFIENISIYAVEKKIP